MFKNDLDHYELKRRCNKLFIYFASHRGNYSIRLCSYSCSNVFSGPFLLLCNFGRHWKQKCPWIELKTHWVLNSVWGSNYWLNFSEILSFCDKKFRVSAMEEAFTVARCFSKEDITYRYRIAFTCKFSICFLFQDPDQADMAFLRPWGVKITIRASTWNRHTHLDIVSPPVSKDRVYKCN